MSGAAARTGKFRKIKNEENEIYEIGGIVTKAANYRGTEKVGCKRLQDFKTLGEECLYVKKYRKK